MATRIALLLVSALLAAPASAQTSDGATVYKRCAACHLATGAGIPGAFPPLRTDIRALAAKSDGRRYLVLVVTKGISGPITVEGKPYRGVMPAQAGLGDAQVAAVLNHVLATSAKGGTAKPFTAAEVAQVKAGATGLTPAAIGKLNAVLLAK
jgi:mono/diheme cytochrome c family protein